MQPMLAEDDAANDDADALAALLQDFGEDHLCEVGVPLAGRVLAVDHKVAQHQGGLCARLHRLKKRCPHRDKWDVIVAAEGGDSILVAVVEAVLPALLGALLRLGHRDR